MADSWEDEADDWEAEADKLVAGVDINDVDESKFEGEDEGAPDSWEDSVPASQVRGPPSSEAATPRSRSSTLISINLSTCS